MPVPLPSAKDLEVFPSLTRADIDAARTSAWIETFEDISVPATVVDLDALGERDAFLEWLHADSIYMPEDSEDTVRGPRDPAAPVYRLPKLTAALRSALARYPAVFPKLNWTAPRDAGFLLPLGAGPLNCTSPADVYLLLASSDLVNHDLDPARAYAGAERDADSAGAGAGAAPLEIVLKQYVAVDPAREFRAFVRDRTLVGISQRDQNYYDHLQAADTRARVAQTIREFWEDEVRENYAGGADYTFDVVLDPQHASATVLDFGVYRPSTDPLLFTYDELLDILVAARAAAGGAGGGGGGGHGDGGGGGHGEAAPARLPVLRVLDDAADPRARRNAPSHQANMMPWEAVQLSAGQGVDGFREAWARAVAGAAEGSGSDDDDESDADVVDESEDR